MFPDRNLLAEFLAKFLALSGKIPDIKILSLKSVRLRCRGQKELLKFA
jgi:hypothetical protein